VSQSQDLSLALEEITLGSDSELIGKTIRDSGLKERFNAMVVAIKRGEDLHFNPAANKVLAPYDVLILIGEKQKITRIS
jgi:K+/H+ antiporter YhaU regulatory subunit KhtT